MPTKAQINVAAVSFSSTNITRVTAAMFSPGGQLLKFKADTDAFPTVIACVNNEPKASITTADIGTMAGFAPGASGTLSATYNDAKLATNGAVVFTMINAVFENADHTQQHATFGTTTGTWQAYSSDGSTNPLSFARA